MGGAAAGGAFNPKKIKPDGKPSDLFQVVHPDGHVTFPSLFTIENAGWTGYWEMGPGMRMTYFRTDHGNDSD